jgi:hypothetical protein
MKRKIIEFFVNIFICISALNILDPLEVISYFFPLYILGNEGTLREVSLMGIPL